MNYNPLKPELITKIILEVTGEDITVGTRKRPIPDLLQLYVYFANKYCYLSSHEKIANAVNRHRSLCTTHMYTVQDKLSINDSITVNYHDAILPEIQKHLTEFTGTKYNVDTMDNITFIRTLGQYQHRLKNSLARNQSYSQTIRNQTKAKRKLREERDELRREILSLKSELRKKKRMIETREKRILTHKKRANSWYERFYKLKKKYNSMQKLTL